MGTQTIAAMDNDPTSLSAAQANVKASAEAIAANLNVSTKKFYNDAFDAYDLCIAIGRPRSGPPPVVPASWVVVTDKEGWSAYEQTGPPVCAARTPQQGTGSTLDPKKPNTIHIGKRNRGAWFAAGAEDTIEGGREIFGTSEDGVTGTFEKFEAIFGGGLYLQTS